MKVVRTHSLDQQAFGQSTWSFGNAVTKEMCTAYEWKRLMLNVEVALVNTPFSETWILPLALIYECRF